MKFWGCGFEARLLQEGHLATKHKKQSIWSPECVDKWLKYNKIRRINQITKQHFMNEMWANIKTTRIYHTHVLILSFYLHSVTHFKGTYIWLTDRNCVITSAEEKQRDMSEIKRSRIYKACSRTCWSSPREKQIKGNSGTESVQTQWEYICFLVFDSPWCLIQRDVSLLSVLIRFR